MRGEMSVPGYWRLRGGRYSPDVKKFPCGHTFAWHRPICPECRYNKRREEEAAREAALARKMAENVRLQNETKDELTALFCPALLSIGSDQNVQRI